MYKTVSRQVRPDKNIEFWKVKSPETSAYIKEKYLDSGKIQKVDFELSTSELALTTSTYWNEESDYIEFRDDPVIIDQVMNPMSDYVDQMKIRLYAIDERHDMVAKQGPNPYPNLVIPETWEDVDDFADWWISNGMPLKFSSDAEVFMSDDATSIALFKKGRFQVELYLIHPCPKVPSHEHPDVNVIKVRLGGKKYPYLSNTLRNGNAHGAGIRLEAEDKGYPLLAIQHWLTREPTTIASMWKGETVGPKQEDLIRRFNPDAFIESGYADITRSNKAPVAKSQKKDLWYTYVVNG